MSKQNFLELLLQSRLADSTLLTEQKIDSFVPDLHFCIVVWSLRFPICWQFFFPLFLSVFRFCFLFRAIQFFSALSSLLSQLNLHPMAMACLTIRVPHLHLSLTFTFLSRKNKHTRTNLKAHAIFVRTKCWREIETSAYRNMDCMIDVINSRIVKILRPHSTIHWTKKASDLFLLLLLSQSYQHLLTTFTFTMLASLTSYFTE